MPAARLWLRSGCESPTVAGSGVAVLNPTNNNLYLATDASPGSILRVIPS